MKAKDALLSDTPVLCRLIASKPMEQMHSLNDIRNHTKFVFETIEGEEVDLDGVKNWPNKWPLHQRYTYKALNYSDDPKLQPHSKQDRALVVAFRQYQLYLRYIKFRRERDPAASANFRFEWSHDLAVFGGNANVLGQAYLPSSDPLNSFYSGLIQINDNWPWGIYGKEGAAFFLQLLIHELFHSIGYHHDTLHLDSVVYPFANGKLIFIETDKYRLWSDYGRRLLPMWIVDNICRRLINGYDFD